MNKPTTARSSAAPVAVRTLHSMDNDQIVASASWSCPMPGSGVVLIAHLEVEADHRRRGHGSRLLDALVRDAMSDPAVGRLRRIVAPVAQKSQVHARAFFTRHGFHHTGTLNDLLRGEDLLIYSKAYD